MKLAAPVSDLYPETTVTATINDVEVPWTFGDVGSEYEAIRGRAAMIDLSCVSLISITGAGSVDFVQSVVTRDVGYLFPERCMSALVVDITGKVIDLVVVYKTQGGFLLETSFGRGEATFRFLTSSAPADVTVEDVSATHSVIGVEGPFAWQVLGQAIGGQVTGLTYQGVLTTEWEGEEIRISRSGYTGEYGYKLIAHADVTRKLWDRLAQEIPIAGFEAVETTMLEVRQPLLHRELDGDGNVISCSLNYLVDPDKEEFVAREAIFEQKERATAVTVGFAADSGTALPAGARILVAGELEIGRVVHSAYSPGVGKAIGVARIGVEWAASGLDLDYDPGDGALQPLRTTSSPYLIPMSWGIPIQ